MTTRVDGFAERVRDFHRTCSKLELTASTAKSPRPARPTILMGVPSPASAAPRSHRTLGAISDVTKNDAFRNGRSRRAEVHRALSA